MRAYETNNGSIKALIVEPRDGHITIAKMIQWIIPRITQVKITSNRKERTSIYLDWGHDKYDIIYYGDLILNVRGEILILREGAE